MKRTVLFFLIFALIICAVPLASAQAPENAVVEFGMYPQSEVKDNKLIKKLNEQEFTWESYNYYSGTGTWSDGKMKPGNFMMYADVKYGGKMYRAVRIKKYRPHWTAEKVSFGSSIQKENGYAEGRVYWFEYEPVCWRVIDAGSGLLLSDKIIDSQPYTNVIKQMPDNECSSGSGSFAGSWEHSDLRSWLNGSFTAGCFSAAEIKEIKETKLENPCRKAAEKSDSPYDGKDTTDKVFLLSYEDSLTPGFGFTGAADSAQERTAPVTDYAKIQGCMVTETGPESSGSANWWLRTPADNSYNVCCVMYDGEIRDDMLVIYTMNGVRPALSVNNAENLPRHIEKSGGIGKLFAANKTRIIIIAADIVLLALIALLAVMIYRKKKNP